MEFLQHIFDLNPTLQARMLLLSIIAPWICAAFLLRYGHHNDRRTQWVSVLGFATPAVIAFWLWSVFNVHYQSSGYLFYMEQSKIGISSLGIALKLGLNGISMPLYLMASIVGLAAGLYAIQADVENRRFYLALLLVMQGGLMGIFASMDIFFLYFFHEVALIPTFVLIGYWGDRGRRVAAMEMTIYLTLGAMLSLIGLISIYMISGLQSFDIISLRSYLTTMPMSHLVQDYIFGILLLGLGILVSLFPFHSWAPRGYAAAPASAAMLHAGVLKKFGLYTLIQVALPLLPMGAMSWTSVLIWLALGNVVIIGFITISKRDLKQMLGYSSVMHMGYIFIGIATLSKMGIGGAIVLMVAHGLSISLLFMLADMIQIRSGSSDLYEMGAMGKDTPVLAGFFVAATMAGVGLPGFANFWGELTVFVSIWNSWTWALLPAVIGIVISAIYGLRAAARIFMGEESELFKERKEEGRRFTDMTLNERLPAAILLAMLFIFGFWPRGISKQVNASLDNVVPAMQVEVVNTAALDSF